MTGAWPRTLAGLTAALALVAGCGADPAAPTTTPAPATTAAPTTTSGPQVVQGTAQTGPAGASSPRPTWSTGPVTVAHTPAVPPVPVLTGVRSAGHPDQGYDRIVFDIQGSPPGYSARYVSEVRADPSDRPITVPGRHHLLIVFRPMQAHRDSGAVTVGGVHRVGLPMLTSYAVVGDFEGYVSIALGLDEQAGYRIGELPGRIYVDVAH
jgi:hypothetical protein